MDLSELQTQRRLLVCRKITATANQYLVHAVSADGSEGPIVAFAERKRTADKERITVHTDESRTQVLAECSAREVPDPASGHDVTDPDGKPIGFFRRDLVGSSLRSAWHLQQPGLPTMTGTERSPVVGLLRRLSDSLAWLPCRFDFSVGAQIAFSVVRRRGLHDRYLVEIGDPRLDRRLVIATAVAVALDVLQPD